jgi:predicted PurR-regulated permease PerM
MAYFCYNGANMQTKIIERYFFFILLFATFIFSFFIFRPFWIVLVLGISFSIVLYPVYEWLTKRKLPSWLAALITVLFFTIIIGGLVLGVGIVVLKQSQNFYSLFTNSGSTLSFIDSVNNSINKVLPVGISFNLYDKISGLISFVVNNITSAFTTTLYTLFGFFLTFISIFYFLKDSAHWKKSIIVFSPLSDVDDEKIIKKLSLAVRGIIEGYFSIVFIQGTLVAIGFAIFGVPNPVLWGLVAMITSFVPTIGSGLVSIPAIIFLFSTGNVGGAIGLLIWAVLMVGTIDNILNPIIVGSKINLHPLLILFSVLGGISLFGPAGILVGPLTISLLYTLISIYRNEFKQSIIS